MWKSRRPRKMTNGLEIWNEANREIHVRAIFWIVVAGRLNRMLDGTCFRLPTMFFPHEFKKHLEVSNSKTTVSVWNRIPRNGTRTLDQRYCLFCWSLSQGWHDWNDEEKKWWVIHIYNLICLILFRVPMMVNDDRCKNVEILLKTFNSDS